MKQFQSYSPDTSYSNDNSIPKNIYMFWNSHKLSDAMHDNIQSWITKNPDWSIYLYDGNQAKEFIDENLSQDVLQAYNNIIPKAYNADLFRYCVLYTLGGVYVDIKMVPIRPLNDIISNDLEFLSVKDKHDKNYEFDGYIAQALLCARPQHPFFKKAIDMIVNNSQKGFYGNDPLCPTGPGLLGKAINICCDRPETAEIESGTHNINNYKFELLKHHDKSIFDMNGKQFTKIAYSGYRKELYADGELAKSYPICWFNGKCYVENNQKPKSRYYLRKKEFFIVDYLYLVKNHKKARLFAIKSCILKPLLASRIISRVINYEKAKD